MLAPIEYYDDIDEQEKPTQYDPEINIDIFSGASIRTILYGFRYFQMHFTVRSGRSLLVFSLVCIQNADSNFTSIRAFEVHF